MAAEELGSSFDANPNEAQQNQSQPKDTSSFRLGLAQAFAQEEAIQEDLSYTPPLKLAKVQEFMSVFDFTDRNNPEHRFEIVSSIHYDILAVQDIINQMREQTALTFQARQRLQEDLYLLETYRKQTFDFMEETRPRY